MSVDSLNDYMPYEELPKDKVNVIVPPRFYFLATAVQTVTQNRTGKATLIYEDGTTESAKLSYDIITEESFFKIVGDVQAIARKE